MDPALGADVSWDRKCAYCQGNKVANQIVGFSLPHYLHQDPETEPAAVIARSLEQYGNLRHGSLYRCRHCGRPWLEVGDGFCTAMTKRDIPVVIRWDDHPLAPDAHLPALAEIGATPGHSFVEALEVPAMVRVGSNWVDPCRVRLQNAPPLTAGHPSVIFVDDVERIEPTEFALPLEFREYSHKVPERAIGYAPFDVQVLGGKLYVTFALQDADKHDDVAGKGHGFVDVFDTSGHFQMRFASKDDLNSPWAVVQAPAGFGDFGNR